MAQAHGCQRNSCGSVRRGRGGDRYNQRLCVCERGSVCVCEKERENVPVCVRVCVCVCMHMCPCACMYARSYVHVGVGVGTKGEDPATPGPARIDPGTVTIPQCRLNKTKQHTLVRFEYRTPSRKERIRYGCFTAPIFCLEFD